MRAAQAVLAMALAALAGCSEPSGEAAAPPPALTLETRAVQAVLIASTRDWDGRIEAIDQATLAAQTGGRVAELAVDVGDVVEDGAVLARFTAIEQKAGQRQALAALEAARASAGEAAASLRRVEGIYARGLVSRSELDRAKAASEAAQAQLAAARAGLRSADERVGYTAIRAPYRGVVTARHVEPGETVAAGQPLLSGLSLDRLRLRVDVPQSLAQRLRADTPAFVVAADGERIAATRITVFPQAEGASQRVGVRLDLPEGVTGFVPGASAKAVFALEQHRVLAVPATAISRRGEVESVFVKDGRGGVELRQVRIGRRLDNAEVEVLAGLSEGEQVALDAAAGLEARRAQRVRMAGR